MSTCNCGMTPHEEWCHKIQPTEEENELIALRERVDALRKRVEALETEVAARSQWVCAYCNSTLPSKEALKTHFKEVHKKC